MSHFAGLVISTPKYASNHTIDDALAKYDENTKAPEYSKGAVSDFEKIRFVMYYKYDKAFEKKAIEAFYYYAILKGLAEPYNEENPQHDTQERCAFRCMYDNEEEYAKFMLSVFPEFLNGFKELYEEKGEDWNGNTWRVSPISGKWEEYSTYNPDSKWDWWDDGGRWNCTIKTKSGELVNQCLLGEIDWSDFKDSDYCKKPAKNWKGETYRKLKKGVEWHFTKSDLPFCFVVDGEWIEKGKMGWWAMTSNEMSDEDWQKKMFDVLDKLPEDSEVYLVDFHI